ncbi:hypothetical protein ACXET9_07125 [Brachybacterium sp. DNPG3]
MMRVDAKLVFLDLETTSLDKGSARPWEIGMIERTTDGRETRTTILVSDVDLTDAEPAALRIGRFRDRWVDDGRARWMTEREAAERVAAATTVPSGRVILVGSAVGDYDSAVLEAMLRRHGHAPGWWHHSIDPVTWTIAAMAMSPFTTVSLAQASSYALSKAAGTEPPGHGVAHTAMGDAQWAADWWDSLTKGWSV